MAKVASPLASLVEALGTAWTIHGLYPDPEAQPAFQRASETISAIVVAPVSLEVGPGAFLSEGEVIKVDREGSDRLARRCFIHNLEHLRFLPGVGERDLLRLFSVIAKDEATVSTAGGVESALLRSGVDKVAVVQRAFLKKSGEEEPPPDRDPEVEELLAEAADPKRFAAMLMEEAGGDSKVAAAMFERLYLDILGKVAADDFEGRERVVQAFVEAFFFLPEEPQLAVFESFLDRMEHPPFQTFLDQFAGHELVRLAPKLDPEGLAALLDYARVATDQADRRPDELMALLESPDAVGAARAVIAEKIGERLGGLAGAGTATPAVMSRIQLQIPDRKRFFYDALEVFRGLLHAEERDTKFSRLLRIWSGKVGAAIRRGELRRAELWLRSALDAPTYQPHRRAAVDNALDYLAESDALSHVLEAAAETTGNEPAVRILRALGARAVGRLIQLLAEADEGAQRRALIEVLAQVGAPDPAPIAAHLNDPRWYVVRNLVIVLGKTANPAALPALEQAITHPDHRVRVEALRAIATALPGKAVSYLERGLRDSNENVQMAAIGFLSAYPEAERFFINALESAATQLEVRLRIIRTLGQSPSAESALNRLAKKRLAFSSSTRQLRDAARTAIKERP